MDYAITEKELKELGINLNENDQSDLLRHLNDELSIKVGEAIMRELSEQQVDEYNKITEDADNGMVESWIIKQIPNFEQIVQDEINVVLGKIAEKAKELSSK